MSTESRRSTAAQFFMEQDDVAGDNTNTSERVVELLNQASLLQKDAQRISNLNLVQELIVNKEPALLDSFLDEMLAFQNDRSPDVRKFVVGFIEESCKRDPEILPKVMGHLMLLIRDENVAVVKKVILTMTQLYKVALNWVAKARTVSDVMEQTWGSILQMKADIMEMVDSDNDGVRTHSVKFIENITIVLSRRTPESDTPKRFENDISLDKIPDPHQVLSFQKLEEEGKKALDCLLQFMASLHISSVNLMTTMGALTNIAKQRPQYFTRVVPAFEALHVNLPPTLAKSQVSSVRKNLKMQMLSLLKHPSSYDQHPQITTLLTDLGATQSEVMRNMPKVDESRKRKNEDSSSGSKKAKIEITLDKEEDDYIAPLPSTSSTLKKVSAPKDSQQSAIEVTSEDLVSKLTPQNVADLVLLSMVMLPETMPAHFQATYTPIAAAGTQAQIKHLSRLLATQLTAAGLGKGVQEQGKGQAKAPKEDEKKEKERSKSPTLVQTPIGPVPVSLPQPVPPPAPVPLPVPPPQAQAPSRKGIKVFKLAAVTMPMDPLQMDVMACEAFRRVLKAEKTAIQGNAGPVQAKILTGLVSLYGGLLKNELQDFIFEDLRNRSELALAWIYQEYANYQGFNVTTAGMEKQTIASYDECLTRLLNGLLERPDQREGLFSRLLLEAPCITPNAILVLKKYCQDDDRIFFGMTTLKELILMRPSMKIEFLEVLLDFTSHERKNVRDNAIRVAKKLHERSDLRVTIEKSALYSLKHLLQPSPPAELFGRGEIAEEWSEDTIRQSLYLYLGLLPVNHHLIHELATVYTATSADIKRTILRVLEQPVKGMGMHSPELLLLVENCPRGAETLVTRIIHILTDKASPSPELVERVRDLYHKRVSDVRFLIPVLNGLSKKEVIQALPRLIKLKPDVVREVFNRLLGSHNQDTSYSSPLTPAELLVALHNIDSSKCDMKTIIRATNLCFSEKAVYTQEVLCVVMKELMEQTPLPTLFMRTVIQSLAIYPRLIGLALNIMQRLISKQVWKDKKVWEGFVKCCQRTKPQSFQVLLQLPAPQLKNAFEISPELREPLLDHVRNLTDHQRGHIPHVIMKILEKDPADELKAAEEMKQAEEAKLAKARQEAQEQLYQQRLEEARKKQQEGKDGDEDGEDDVVIKMEEGADGDNVVVPQPQLDPEIRIKEEPKDDDSEVPTITHVVEAETMDTTQPAEGEGDQQPVKIKEEVEDEVPEVHERSRKSRRRRDEKSSSSSRKSSRSSRK